MSKNERNGETRRMEIACRRKKHIITHMDLKRYIFFILFFRHSFCWFGRRYTQKKCQITNVGCRNRRAQPSFYEKPTDALIITRLYRCVCVYSVNRVLDFCGSFINSASFLFFFIILSIYLCTSSIHKPPLRWEDGAKLRDSLWQPRRPG